MAGFLFRLATTESEPAEPPTVSVAVPDWPVGPLIHSRGRTLRVVGRRDDDGDQPPVLIVGHEEGPIWVEGRSLTASLQRGKMALRAPTPLEKGRARGDRLFQSAALLRRLR